MQILQFVLDGLKGMLQFEFVSNEHLPPPPGVRSITLSQRNRAPTFGSTRDRRGKRGLSDGNRKNIPRRGREF